jgi:hypothetical protein
MMKAVELDSEVPCSVFVFLDSGCLTKCSTLSAVNVMQHCQNTVEVNNLLVHVLYVGIK